MKQLGDMLSRKGDDAEDPDFDQMDDISPQKIATS